MTPAAVVFDLFGTLLDITSLREVAAFVPDPAAFVSTWREKQLAYAFASAIMGRHEDFDVMTAYALQYAAEKHGVSFDDSMRARLLGAWECVQPFEDAVPTLRALDERGIRCAVLTNGTPATARAAALNAGIEALLDVTLSVESAGVYKPDRRVYALATAHYGVTPGHLIFATSNGWDATGAAAFGMRVAWCNRAGGPAERFGPAPEWTMSDLRELVALITAT